MMEDSTLNTVQYLFNIAIYICLNLIHRWHCDQDARFLFISEQVGVTRNVSLMWIIIVYVLSSGLR
jgi:hypothetical protein